MFAAEFQNSLSSLKDFRYGECAGEDLLYHCTKLYDCLAVLPVLSALRRKAEEFGTLTGPGSPLDDIRKNMCKLTGTDSSTVGRSPKEMTPWCAVDIRLTVDSLRQSLGLKSLEPDVGVRRGDGKLQRPLLPAEARNTSVLLRWWCVGEHTIHDLEWVRCNLYTTYAITQYTVESETKFVPDAFNDYLLKFRDQLWAVWKKSDQEHLLGAYLLMKCHEAVDSGPAASSRLIEVLCELDVQARAVSGAAEHLLQLLTELPGQSQSPDLKVPPNNRPSASGENSSETSNTKKTASEVTISMGDRCYILLSEGIEPLYLTGEQSAAFAKFVHRVAIGAPGELIPWEEINRVAGITQPTSTSRQEQFMAKQLSDLNRRLTRWAVPPDAGAWIGTVKGKKGGRSLNASVKWLANTDHPLMNGLTRRSQSVSGPELSPIKAAQLTPERGTQMPARARHAPPRSDQDGDE